MAPPPSPGLGSLYFAAILLSRNGYDSEGTTLSLIASAVTAIAMGSRFLKSYKPMPGVIALAAILAAAAELSK